LQIDAAQAQELSFVKQQLRLEKSKVGLNGVRPQSTIHSFLTNKNDTASKAKVAQSLRGPRELIHQLGMRHSDGRSLESVYLRHDKYTHTDLHHRASDRMMLTADLSVMACLEALHADPGKTEEMLQHVAYKHRLHGATVDIDLASTPLVRSLVSSYNSSSSVHERTIIAYVLVMQFNQQECEHEMGLNPPLTLYRYRMARNHAMVWGSGRPAPYMPIKRDKMPLQLLQDALSFIYDQENLQQVNQHTLTCPG
jgi:hypothetical protein